MLWEFIGQAFVPSFVAVVAIVVVKHQPSLARTCLSSRIGGLWLRIWSDRWPSTSLNGVLARRPALSDWGVRLHQCIFLNEMPPWLVNST